MVELHSSLPPRKLNFLVCAAGAVGPCNAPDDRGGEHDPRASELRDCSVQQRLAPSAWRGRRGRGPGGHEARAADDLGWCLTGGHFATRLPHFAALLGHFRNGGMRRSLEWSVALRGLKPALTDCGGVASVRWIDDAHGRPSDQAGVVELYEQDMIEGVLDLQRSQVQQIMTPRVEIIAISEDSPLSDFLTLAREYKYSRVPVYNQTIDEITGVVLIRELLDFAGTSAGWQ